ncbi:hypothetical protein Tco_0774729 [Tanacetum coccineum]|uniref:Uncharacterized protein n=1 Tax=Tanacetum coccineum TaxID=301880 RepID=A0ABQ4ZTK5_9ASTR
MRGRESLFPNRKRLRISVAPRSAKRGIIPFIGENSWNKKLPGFQAFGEAFEKPSKNSRSMIPALGVVLVTVVGTSGFELKWDKRRWDLSGVLGTLGVGILVSDSDSGKVGGVAGLQWEWDEPVDVMTLKDDTLKLGRTESNGSSSRGSKAQETERLRESFWLSVILDYMTKFKHPMKESFRDFVQWMSEKEREMLMDRDAQGTLPQGPKYTAINLLSSQMRKKKRKATLLRHSPQRSPKRRALNQVMMTSGKDQKIGIYKNGGSHAIFRSSYIRDSRWNYDSQARCIRRYPLSKRVDDKDNICLARMARDHGWKLKQERLRQPSR